MSLNRRGNWLVFFMAVGSLIIFAYLFSVLYIKSSQITEYIGYEQFRILDAYSEGEKALYFTDLAAEYSAYDALAGLAARGGLSTRKCGSFKGFTLWDMSKSECYPTASSALKSFEEIYPDFLNRYFLLYSDADLPDAKYYNIFTEKNAQGNLILIGNTTESIAIYPPGELKASIDSSKGFAYPVEKNGGGGGSYLISSCFGKRDLLGSVNFHKGVDFAHPQGTAVFAVDDGIVEYVYSGCRENCNVDSNGDWEESCFCGSGYGNRVNIKHSEFETVYAHLDKVTVKEGDKVVKGQQIGTVGSTGKSTGAHLHFELRINNKQVEPLCLFNVDSSDFLLNGDNCDRNRIKESCGLITAKASYTSQSSDEKRTEGDFTYFVKPYFKVPLAYDFSVYDRLREKANSIYNNCKNANYDERENCLIENANALSDSSISIKYPCVENQWSWSDAEVLKMFKDIEDSCLNANDGCYCDVDLRKLVLHGIQDGTYALEVIPDSNNVGGTIRARNCLIESCTNSTSLVWLSENYNQDFYDLGFPEANRYEYTLTIYISGDRVSSAELKFINSSGEEELWDASRIIIFKKRGVGGETFSMIVNKNAFESSENHFRDVGSCGFAEKNFTFCASDLMNRIPAYDDKSKKLEYSNPVIKFALKI